MSAPRKLQVSLTVDGRGVAVDFDVAAGETVALLGPNGAGKSTVLSVIAGVLRPDRGRVVLDGREITGADTWVAPHDRRIAMLAQQPLLFPHLSVLDNVAFGPRSRGSRRREAHATARHWLDEVDATGLADRKPAQLSGGQAQRVAVARALAAQPELLLLDEPMAALDVAVQPALRQTLRRVLAERTVLLVTHDVLDALLLADRVVVLEDGQVVESGPVSEVLSAPRSAFAARIAGLNLLAGEWRDGAVTGTHGARVHGLVGGSTTGPPAPGDPVVAVFRPNAVSVFARPPGGSPRNSLEVAVTDLEPHGDWVRIRATYAGTHLSADVTTQAAADLDLVVGSTVTFSIKATEVSIHPTTTDRPAGRPDDR